jgi:hypothetical protein
MTMKAKQGRILPVCVALTLFSINVVIGSFMDHDSDPAAAKIRYWQGTTNSSANNERQLISGLKRTNQAKEWRKQWRNEDENLRKVFNCVGGPENDISMSRWGHEKPLYKDQYICSHRKPYVFGLTAEGDLLWVNVRKAQIRRFFRMPDPPKDFNDTNMTYFQISVEAHLQVFDGNENLLWEVKPKVDDITNTSCLEDYDCPYLHLHSDGVNVLNYRDPDDYYYWDEWDVRNAYRYND